MRLVEALFLASLAAAFLLGFTSLAGLGRLAASVLLVGGLLLVHLTVDGARWQMIPAYASALGLAALVAGRLFGPAPTLWPYGAALGLVGVLAAAAAGLAVPVFRLPAPPGPYPIGTSSIALTDWGRADPFTGEPGRRLVAQIWYPAQAGTGVGAAPYVEDGAALAPLARLLGLPGWALGHLALVRTHARSEAAMAASSERWPVVIFAHGRGGFRQHNTGLVEALASHGYVVVALDQPGAAAGVRLPDGRRLDFDPRMADRAFAHAMAPALAEDITFLIDALQRLNAGDLHERWKARFDLTRLGAAGVSLGGAVIAQACVLDQRIRACLPIDVYMPPAAAAGGLSQPTLWITRDAETMRREGWAEIDVAETQETIASAWSGMAAPGYVLRAPGAYHVDFSDAALMAPGPVGRRLGLIGPAKPGVVGQLTTRAAIAFFDHALRGASIEPLEAAARRAGASLELNAAARLSSPPAGPPRSALP